MSNESKLPDEYSETDFLDKQPGHGRKIAEGLVQGLKQNLRQKEEEASFPL